MSGGLNEYLQQASLLRLLAVMALVVTPHLARLPLWESLLLVVLMIWRTFAALRQWRMPPRWFKVGLTLLAFAGVQMSFGRTHGQIAGVALFVAMLVLKLMEMRERRDVMIVVFLMYFILLTHFLYSQELWTILYLLLSAVAITAVLAEASHPRTALSPRVSWRLGSRMVLMALPLMVVMFILFPRIPGPLWGLPSDSGASARSGLSDSMSPGDIVNLIQSDELAFRARFINRNPERGELYWRGPVFWDYDGRRWDAGSRSNAWAAPNATFSGEPLRYEIIMEPLGNRWLMALELPTPGNLPQGSALNADYSLISRRKIQDRRLYTVTSYPEYRLQADLPRYQRNLALALPEGFNPRTAELMSQWRAQHPSDEALILQALQHFREQAFVYTLQPPPLGRNAVDDFLFDTRRGFCEHYASSFTVMMRLAGIPARVVTGYQGGELNELGGYFQIRQSDAHAWSEVWLPERGWVRVDPTAAVAPNRIESGLGDAIGLDEGLPGYLAARTRLKLWFEARWDLANALWNRWVLGYGPEFQAQFLSRFGIDDWGQMILILTVLLTVGMSLMGLLMLRQALPVRHEDPVQRLWLKALKQLRRAGESPRPGEGPSDFIDRVASTNPGWSSALRTVLHHYLKTRYLSADQVDSKPLARAVSGLRRSLRRSPATTP